MSAEEYRSAKEKLKEHKKKCSLIPAKSIQAPEYCFIDMEFTPDRDFREITQLAIIGPYGEKLFNQNFEIFVSEEFRKKHKLHGRRKKYRKYIDIIDAAPIIKGILGRNTFIIGYGMKNDRKLLEEYFGISDARYVDFGVNRISKGKDGSRLDLRKLFWKMGADRSWKTKTHEAAYDAQMVKFIFDKFMDKYGKKCYRILKFTRLYAPGEPITNESLYKSANCDSSALTATSTHELRRQLHAMYKDTFIRVNYDEIHTVIRDAARVTRKETEDGILVTGYAYELITIAVKRNKNPNDSEWKILLPFYKSELLYCRNVDDRTQNRIVRPENPCYNIL